MTATKSIRHLSEMGSISEYNTGFRTIENNGSHGNMYLDRSNYNNNNSNTIIIVSTTSSANATLTPSSSGFFSTSTHVDDDDKGVSNNPKGVVERDDEDIKSAETTVVSGQSNPSATEDISTRIDNVSHALTLNMSTNPEEPSCIEPPPTVSFSQRTTEKPVSPIAPASEKKIHQHTLYHHHPQTSIANNPQANIMMRHAPMPAASVRPVIFMGHIADSNGAPNAVYFCPNNPSNPIMDSRTSPTVTLQSLNKDGISNSKIEAKDMQVGAANELPHSCVQGTENSQHNKNTCMTNVANTSTFTADATDVTGTTKSICINSDNDASIADSYNRNNKFLHEASMADNGNRGANASSLNSGSIFASGICEFGYSAGGSISKASHFSLTNHNTAITSPSPNRDGTIGISTNNAIAIDLDDSDVKISRFPSSSENKWMMDIDNVVGTTKLATNDIPEMAKDNNICDSSFKIKNPDGEVAISSDSIRNACKGMMITTDRGDIMSDKEMSVAPTAPSASFHLNAQSTLETSLQFPSTHANSSSQFTSPFPFPSIPISPASVAVANHLPSHLPNHHHLDHQHPDHLSSPHLNPPNAVSSPKGNTTESRSILLESSTILESPNQSLQSELDHVGLSHENPGEEMKVDANHHYHHHKPHSDPMMTAAHVNSYGMQNPGSMDPSLMTVA
eukprot:CAMPEP_0175061498 /NCGR_PEP_ID=MMETSP0052_2-20121109/13618_1 /TAXON_ID=51329 ORGANISM="Polytomella parva, Strain SAG 63-3" /NCGR_SAMPLE_ID=MMETSP0052_2 /ASSEMBLY_ACC=CAM_ASM_000194 /LENGTH=677 /DNA_ID=CAMNT_0016327359 /DNA_START=95 /DNA_END=2125 /DNA_ORIENTATION=-